MSQARAALAGILAAHLLSAQSPDGPPADQIAYSGLKPAEAAAKATLPPGFKMHVFSAEPDLRNPIAYCDDDRGRIWVVEGLTYPKRVGAPPKPSPASPPKPGTTPGIAASPDQVRDIFGGRDRILVLDDTDGDHVADRTTVFLEGVNLVSGIEYGFGGLWIGAAPYLLFVPIEEGDAPKPAGPPRIVLDGWDYAADTHETLNTFVWGPDGWLYGCHGVFCPSNVGYPGAPEADRQWMDAGVWRFHPVRQTFEVFTEGGSNPWGIDFDEQGNLWAEMCVIPHLWHMIPGARLERQGGEHFCVGPDETTRNSRHRDPRSRKPVYPHAYDEIRTHADHVHWAGGAGPHAANGRSDAVGGGHAHAGLMCYLGTSWPTSYRGGLFIGNIHGQRLNVDRPEPRGSGFVGRHAPDFLNFNDTWSQTLNQRLDPDGSVFIIDWYDANQCHHNREDGHDRGNGRIYKIVYQRQPKTSINVAAASDEELLNWVASRNEWLSRKARRQLHERAARQGGSGRNATLDSTLARNLAAAGDTAARLRWLWAQHLAGLDVTPDITDDPIVLGWSLTLAFEGGCPADTARQRNLRAQLETHSQSASPMVRRCVASALQRIPAAERWPVLERLLQHEADNDDHNLPNLYWGAAEGAVASDPQRGLELLRKCRIPKLREYIARRIASASVASR
jgi:putative membrane-bound dehydrogenase-like protein